MILDIIRTISSAETSFLSSEVLIREPRKEVRDKVYLQRSRAHKLPPKKTLGLQPKSTKKPLRKLLSNPENVERPFSGGRIGKAGGGGGLSAVDDLGGGGMSASEAP